MFCVYAALLVLNGLSFGAQVTIALTDNPFDYSAMAVAVLNALAMGLCTFRLLQMSRVH